MAAPTPESGDGLLSNIRRWLALHPAWTLTLAVLALLGPFLAKPFNIDDPLFLWIAGQIHAHPVNPYGFDVNWYGMAQPMWSVTENPPLAGYYLALAAGIFGWGEFGLHAAFLLPALAAIWGTYRLARHFCDQPLLAAIATLFTPVFVISGTTVMCDVLMLAFWVWSVALWLEGTARAQNGRLACAGLLIALAALTKYYGACLIPLLAAYSLIQKQPLKRWGAFLMIPLAALSVYQWATKALYGYALLSEAMNYANYAKGFLGFSGISAGLTALTFTGGCLAVAVFCAPLLCRLRTLVALATGAILMSAALFLKGALMKKYGSIPDGSQLFVEFQIVFWAAGGLWVLAMAVTDVFYRRDPRSWLLALWLFGTFVFAAFFNWTVNGRSMLPMAPVVGILLARRLEQNVMAGHKIRRGAMAVCLGAGAILALFAAHADFLLAVAIRQSAQQACVDQQQENGILWFQGHWGFQYYMQSMGAAPMDLKHSTLKHGDMLAVPANNTSLFEVNPETTTLQKTVAVTGPRWLTTWSAPAGAGFYASSQGPLPFALGLVPPETVSVYVLEAATPAAPKN